VAPGPSEATAEERLHKDGGRARGLREGDREAPADEIGARACGSSGGDGIRRSGTQGASPRPNIMIRFLPVIAGRSVSAQPPPDRRADHDSISTLIITHGAPLAQSSSSSSSASRLTAGALPFDALCREAKRQFDVIMAWSVDRLGRSLGSRWVFLRDTCARDRPFLAPAGPRHYDAGGQGAVSDDGRVCRVRARHDPGTSPCGA
jgi:hypothetical protein